MRMARMAISFAAFLCVPALASAQADQSARSFNDSWFWGVNGGAMFFTAGTDAATKVTAPSVGGEWLITRTRIGLRLAIDQSFFDEATAIVDGSSSGGIRQINVSDWRRYSGEIYFFPKAFGSIHPYAGLGIALHVLQNATPMGSFTTEAAMDSVNATTNDLSTKASTILSAGVQAGFGRSALFVQGSSMPTRRNFLFSGSGYTFMLQAGLRYNVGSAIDKDP